MRTKQMQEWGRGKERRSNTTFCVQYGIISPFLQQLIHFKGKGDRGQQVNRCINGALFSQGAKVQTFFHTLFRRLLPVIVLQKL